MQTISVTPAPVMPLAASAPMGLNPFTMPAVMRQEAVDAADMGRRKRRRSRRRNR